MASERRSLKATARALEERISRAQRACEQARLQVDLATAKLHEAQAALYALQEAYDLVRPKPRAKSVRKEPREAVA